jgi:hypothetical protein
MAAAHPYPYEPRTLLSVDLAGVCYLGDDPMTSATAAAVLAWFTQNRLDCSYSFSINVLRKPMTNRGFYKCSHLLAIGYWLLAVVSCLLSLVYWLLAIGYCLLAIGYWLLSIGYCLLSIGYCPAMAIGYCLLAILS